MKTVYVSFKNSGALSGAEDISRELQEWLDGAKEDFRLVLPPGSYRLDRQLRIGGWKNAVLSGYGVKLITRFTPEDPYTYQGAFRIADCCRFSLEGFTVTTDRKPNILGRVVALDKEALVADIALESGFSLTGREKIVGFHSLDEDFSPNNHVFFSDDHGYRWKLIEKDVMRLFAWPTTGVQLLNLSVGELMCMRHSLYAQCPIVFQGCHDVAVTDVTVYSSPGLSCAVYPDSSNFEFLRFRVEPEFGTTQPFSSNADGIHITGLRGRLRLDSCYFENLGDDALNIHGEGATVYGVQGNEILCYAKRFDSTPETRDGQLSKQWASPGDVISVYDGKTFQAKGEFEVLTYSINKIIAADGGIRPTVGDFLANTSFFAQTEIKNCTVKNTRARGFLIETADVVIENCKFFGITGPAIIAAPDMRTWNEMAPSQHLMIRHNVFEKCGCGDEPKKSGGVLITINHDGNERKRYPAGIHGDITIEGNAFTRLRDTAVFVQSANTLRVRHNFFSPYPSGAAQCIEHYDCTCTDLGENEIV